ncbi:MAG TPA: DUF4012 domain-containing protein [Ktedonobacterales bacterium]
MRHRAILLAILTLILLGTLSGAIDAAMRVSRARAEANDAALHLHRIEALMPSQGNLGELLDPAILQQLQQEMTAAQHDFTLLHSDLEEPAGSFFIAAHLPITNTTIASLGALVDAANQACFAGLDLVKSLQMLNGVLKAGLFASSSPPAQTGTPPPSLNAHLLEQLQQNLEDAFHHLNSAVLYAQHADLSAIPAGLLKPQQVNQVRQLLTIWPSIQTKFAEVEAWLSVAPSLLGVTTPESFLLELMDRSELRSTGGFIGNYGVMTIKNGQVQPFTLSDTYLLDLPYVQKHDSNHPAIYPWWPFCCFGLRDSNISANFPTAAQTGMRMLKLEGGPAVQGVIAFTPPAIARVIKIIGPIVVPDYHETVTDQNLERLIHYYQQTKKNDPLTNLPPSDQISSPRKRFTALLARAFLEKLHGLPTSKLVDIARAAITSLETKDIQVYLSDKNAEALLAQHKFDGTITQGPGDGVTIIDSNVGVNKGSQFTVVSYTDNVTLDAQGTATHNLTITYNYKVTDPKTLFGQDRYLTYLRVYAPANAKLKSLKGLNGGSNQINHSDEPGRQMWGGYVNVQDGKRYSLHLIWSVPNAATADASAHWHYQLIFQHQSGSNQQLTLTVTAPGARAPILTYKGTIDKDKTYNITYAL